jgi:cytochrome c oxidase assembly protein subunit 15
MTPSTSSGPFRTLCAISIAAIYLVILMGGIVRASGAGMGCPDWPRCFGQWVPPTEEAQLPANYHEIYAQRGYADTQFNPVKTWTEYVNRLVGASTGVLVLLTFLAARRYWRPDRPVFLLSLAALLLISFQGWLGSAVVASNLRPVMITVHMGVAFLIVFCMIQALSRAQSTDLQLDERLLPAKFKMVLTTALFMSLLQIIMGTQIRQAIDPLIAAQATDRHIWRESFPIIFYVHRSFSSLILLVNLWMAWNLFRRMPGSPLLRSLGVALGGLVMVAVLSGVTLDRLGFPAFVQPVHLLMANLIMGTQFYLFRLLSDGAAQRAIFAPGSR